MSQTKEQKIFELLRKGYTLEKARAIVEAQEKQVA